MHNRDSFKKLEQKFSPVLVFSFRFPCIFPHFIYIKMITVKRQKSIFKRPSRYKLLFICLIFLLSRVSMAIDS